MERVKHGVIGIGWFGEKHCEAIDSIPNMEIHALCTRTESRLEEVAERFNVKTSTPITTRCWPTLSWNR